ncbi:MAG: c-type cytochrome biogenesis protein CcsB [Candidatus Sumerlaeia bacterium]|nr:c-type cytochrome biogenesis protein CcsB [Candidatus Sumerlaeia bacterium]
MKSTFTHLVALILAVLFASGASAQPATLGLGPEWREAVTALRRLPVQDTGFVRAGHTFSESYISAIAGRPRIEGREPLETMLGLMRNPHAGAHAPLIKLSHPELVRLYDAPRVSVAQWRDMQYRDALVALLHEDQDKWLKVLNSIEYRAGLIENVAGEFAIVPREGTWLDADEAAREGNLDSLDERIVEQWSALRRALATDDAAAGTQAARELVQAVELAALGHGISTSRMKLDLFYHTHKPFQKSAMFCLLAALVYGAALMMARERWNRIGFVLLSLGFVEQLVGIVARWMLGGRAPLSNMYESFTFAIAGMVLVALILEAMKLVRAVGLGAAILGFIFMVIAHKAPIFDSQIRPLMPALQSSWLTYHVVTIMLSYSAFALSFFVAGLYLVKSYVLGGDEGAGLLARRLPTLRAMDVFNYRIIGVGFPLLTIGIIFGAVWAATAWGRPWGFDPKETWSAITWLVYAIYLHVRYLAGWSGRRAAIVAIVGFVSVLFTYFGVNYLLPGLHSYV